MNYYFSIYMVSPSISIKIIYSLVVQKICLINQIIVFYKHYYNQVKMLLDDQKINKKIYHYLERRNFISNKFEQICQKVKNKQIITSQYTFNLSKQFELPQQIKPNFTLEQLARFLLSYQQDIEFDLHFEQQSDECYFFDQLQFRFSLNKQIQKSTVIQVLQRLYLVNYLIQINCNQIKFDKKNSFQRWKDEIQQLQCTVKQVMTHVKHELHFSCFIHEMISQFTQVKNQFLDLSPNVIRFIIVFLLCQLLSMMLKRFQQQIKQQESQQFYDLFLNIKSNESKLNEEKSKTSKAKQLSYEKICRYANDDDIKSFNCQTMQSLMTVKPRLVATIMLFNGQTQFKKHSTVNRILQKMNKSQQSTQIEYIYGQLIQLVFSQIINVNYFNKTSKRMYQKHKTQQQIIRMKLQGLKLTIMLSTIQFYSIRNEIQNQRIIRLRRIYKQFKRKQPKSINQITQMLDMFYIYQGKRLNSTTKLENVTQTWQRYSKYFAIILQFFKKQDQTVIQELQFLHTIDNLKIFKLVKKNLNKELKIAK